MPLPDVLLAKAAHFAQALPVQIALGLMAVALVALLEIAVLGWSRASLPALVRTPSSRRDLLSFALDVTGILRALGHLLTLGIGYAIGLGVRRVLHLDLALLPHSPLAQIALFLFAKSFADYWMHRAMHRYAPLWEIHKYHHSAAEMNIVTAHRESVLVAPFVAVWLALPLGLLGTPVRTFLIVGFLIEFHALLIHSRLAFDFGRLGERLLISPAAHRLHHALDAARHGRNFGFTLSVWDHLFGTHARATDARGIAIGVDDPVYNARSWPREMLYSLRRFAAALRSGASDSRAA